MHPVLVPFHIGITGKGYLAVLIGNVAGKAVFHRIWFLLEMRYVNLFPKEPPLAIYLVAKKTKRQIVPFVVFMGRR